jgi:hypothetical protein
MIDVEQALREELVRLAPATGPADWGEVLTRAGRPSPWPRRSVVAALLITALVAVGAATPLGGAIVGGFSAWLTGEPGSPASKAQQRAFDRANARTWLGFPAGTELRRLSSVDAAGTNVDLFGFRSGTRLCLRVVVSGGSRGSATSCAPVSELRHAGAPVRVVLVDKDFGQGAKRAWFGVDRYRAPAIQVTAGFAADGVRSVQVDDRSGSHVIRAASNAFLYVAQRPDVGQRVRRIRARTSRGLVSVPFAPSPFGAGPFGAVTRAAPGPARVERHVSGGTIGWLDRRELRGSSIGRIPGRSGADVRRHVVFGRVIEPDPGRPERIAVTLSTSRHGGRATGLCTWLLLRGGASVGGCAVRAGLFSKSPIAAELGMDGQFTTIAGLVSDDVARVVAFVADGQTLAVPLADNVFLVDIASSRFPARLVAYDAAGRVIGTAVPPGGTSLGAGPTRGRARLLARGVSGTGATAELFVGGSTTGGRCLYVKWHRSRRAAGEMIQCDDFSTPASPLQLSTDGSPTEFVMGRVHANAARVEVRFADGARGTVAPMQGFVLYTVPKSHLLKGREVVGAAALDASGKVLQVESFRPPKR